mgnify:CR=1 FL=1
MCVPVRQIFCGYQKLSPEIKLLIALLKFKPRRNIDFYMYLEKQAERQRHWNEKQYSNSVDKDNSTDWNWGQDKERQTQSAVPWSRTSPLPLLNWHTPEYQYHTYQQISPEKIIPVYQFGFVNSLDRRGQHAFCEIKSLTRKSQLLVLVSIESILYYLQILDEKFSVIKLVHI